MSSFIAARSDSLAVRSVLTRLLRALIESLRVRTVRLTSSKYARCTESAAFVVACAPTTSCCSLSKSDLVAKKQPARARGRQNRKARIWSLRICPYFGIGQNRRPRCQSRSLCVGELSRAAGLGVENPQLLVSAPRRREDDMPAIRRPGRIIILTFAGELFRNTITKIDHPDLENALLLFVCDRATVRRPVRARTIAAHAGCIRSQQLNVGAVCIYNINLGRARLPRNECDLSTVGAIRR